MSKLIVANWKEYPATEAEAVALAKASDFKGVVICPPHQFLAAVRGAIKYAALGAQDYASDLSDHGAQYAIIGHSDRRAAGDTASIVAEKMALAVGDGLIPILCVGETREERARGARETAIRQQIQTAFAIIRAHDSLAVSQLNPLASEIRNQKSEIWIAYEPVWAISAASNGEPATPADAGARIAYIKEYLLHGSYSFPARFLYGGSITSTNAQAFLEHPDIEGLLVGAATVRNQEIKKLWQLAEHFG